MDQRFGKKKKKRRRRVAPAAGGEALRMWWRERCAYLKLRRAPKRKIRGLRVSLMKPTPRDELKLERARATRCRTNDSLSRLKQSTPRVRPKSWKVSSFSSRPSKSTMLSSRLASDDWNCTCTVDPDSGVLVLRPPIRS